MQLVRLATLWRIVREVDLESIRVRAEESLRLLIIGDSATDADEVAVLLAGDHPEAATWLTAVDAALAARDAAGPAGAPVIDGPDIVVLVTRGAGMSAAMDAVRKNWLDRRARLVHVVLEGAEGHGNLHVDGLTARVSLRDLSPDSLDNLAQSIFAVVEPDRRLALARQFPPLRHVTFDTLIEETARANAGYSFSTGIAEMVPVLGIPLSIGDMIVLTKNQLMMSYRIALAAGKEGRPSNLIAEIVGVLGGGLLFRQIARQLSGMLPVIGIVPKVAVAYGGTWAIGRAVTIWATEGRKITSERLKQLSREGLSRGKRVAEGMRGQGGR